MSVRDSLALAIVRLGGQHETGRFCGCSQATVSTWLKFGHLPVIAAMRIEVLTNGEVKAESLRPDLAELFADYRAFCRASDPPEGR